MTVRVQLRGLWRGKASEGLRLRSGASSRYYIKYAARPVEQSFSLWKCVHHDLQAGGIFGFRRLRYVRSVYSGYSVISHVDRIPSGVIYSELVMCGRSSYLTPIYFQI